MLVLIQWWWMIIISVSVSYSYSWSSTMSTTSATHSSCPANSGPVTVGSRLSRTTIKCFTLGSNNVSICASLGTHAYLCVQQKVCWHTSPMRTIKMLHSSMLTCITHVCSRSYISHVGMLEHSILIAPMGQHTRGFQEQNYYVMYFIKFTWFQLQNKMFHISLHTWIRPHITGWCKSA